MPLGLGLCVGKCSLVSRRRPLGLGLVIALLTPALLKYSVVPIKRGNLQDPKKPPPLRAGKGSDAYYAYPGSVWCYDVEAEYVEDVLRLSPSPIPRYGDGFLDKHKFTIANIPLDWW